MENEIIGRIIGLISCLFCSFPFWIVAIYNKNSKEPINFWSGDKTLKEKVKNVREYNLEMAALYKKCAIVFLITGIGFLFMPLVGIILLIFDCTLGIYMMYRKYKVILNQNS